MQIRIWVCILLLIKVMRICDHWSTDLHISILSLYASNVIVHGTPWLHFEPLKLLNIAFFALLRIRIHLPKIKRIRSGSATLVEKKS
jgi:hypothetical protein